MTADPLQIEGESLSEEARLYRSSRGRLADEYQAQAEAELPEKGITKPSELA